MNYSQIVSPLSPFAFKSGGSCPPAPMGAPPMVDTTTCPQRCLNLQSRYNFNWISTSDYDLFSTL